MRSELSIPAVRREKTAVVDNGVLAVIAFCLAGLLVTLYFAEPRQPLAELPLLIVQYNLM